jgi:hypothetical protein
MSPSQNLKPLVTDKDGMHSSSFSKSNFEVTGVAKTDTTPITIQEMKALDRGSLPPWHAFGASHLASGQRRVRLRSILYFRNFLRGENSRLISIMPVRLSDSRLWEATEGPGSVESERYDFGRIESGAQDGWGERMKPVS